MFTPCRRAGRQRPRTLLVLLLLVTATILYLRRGPPCDPAADPKNPTPYDRASLYDIPSPQMLPALLRPSAASDAPPYNDSTNPLSLHTPLHYGPWQLTVVGELGAGEEVFTLVLRCTAEDTSECPKSYYVQLYGPTAVAVPRRAFVRWGSREVRATVAVKERGQYMLYAWPNALECARDQDQGLPEEQHLFRRLVRGTPTRLSIGGSSSVAAEKEGHEECRGGMEVVADGRWVRGASLTPQAATRYGWEDVAGYVYVPRHCKIPRRSTTSVIRSLRAETVLFLGDSVTRGYVCGIVWPQLFGMRCDERRHGNRRALWRDPVTGMGVDVRFLLFGSDGVEAVMDELRKVRRPDVVVYNVGLWMAAATEHNVRSEHRAFFQAVDKFWGQDARVVVRSTTSVVQPVACFQEGGQGRERSAQLREWLLEETRQWRRRHPRAAFVDAFAMTDARPETTLDGYHWSADEERVGKALTSWDRGVRPLVGEAEESVMDWVWDEMLRMN